MEMSLINKVIDFANMLLDKLPVSPFTSVINNLSLSFDSSVINANWLGWLNWFFPVTETLGIITAWLTAIGVYYVVSVVLRWFKVVS